MKLLPLDAATIPLAAGWLARRENYQWLDFGHGQRTLSPQALALMNSHHTLHALRVFMPDEGDPPIGLVALSDISAAHRTATLWYVLGDKRFGGRGYTTRAVTAALSLGFGELGLRAISAWAVEANVPSIAVLERNGFRRAGRLRQCHEIDGQPHDRVLFDLLWFERTSATAGAEPGLHPAPFLPNRSRGLRPPHGILAEWRR